MSKFLATEYELYILQQGYTSIPHTQKQIDHATQQRLAARRSSGYRLLKPPVENNKAHLPTATCREYIKLLIQ